MHKCNTYRALQLQYRNITGLNLRFFLCFHIAIAFLYQIVIHVMP